ncbi:glycosyltransferase family 2 protein [Reichenbachiella sp. MSK19-1]|uniref:glycosyltransferase n=1 Tax=Reichenbachiella sp. MSK19-1 TaxID=1897631 RepID=UPI000E6C495B|nr:glycosyltransferase [Reichenbachiella sp. MSK19-1]
MSHIYLTRYAYPERCLDVDWHAENPEIIVVLPAHNEPDLIRSLEALEDCACSAAVSVIVMVNASAKASDQVKELNHKSYNEACQWSVDRKHNYHFIINNELPAKHAGVGLARKIGMDEAARAFDMIDKDGVILCFDADSVCEPNLLEEVLHLFSDPKVNGCSIHYEHPMSGDLDQMQYEGIINYELHLRYYIDALRFAGFPYAFQTIGSSMAARSSVYMKQGGMNRRKAGEDFYFLHKIIPLGGFYNLNTTTIYPSARVSDRVPFGTGKAIGDWMEDRSEHYMTYAPQTFLDLKQFLEQVSSCYEMTESEWGSFYDSLPNSIRSFVYKVEFMDKMKEIKVHATNHEFFERRFYQWFDGFKMLKYVHHTRDQFYPNTLISDAVEWLFDVLDLDSSQNALRDKLEVIRAFDQKQP